MELDENFLRDLGAIGVSYVGKWNGLRVLEPVYEGGIVPKMGLPILVLEGNGKRKVIQDDLCFEIIRNVKK